MLRTCVKRDRANVPETATRSVWLEHRSSVCVEGYVWMSSKGKQASERS